MQEVHEVNIKDIVLIEKKKMEKKGRTTPKLRIKLIFLRPSW